MGLLHGAAVVAGLLVADARAQEGSGADLLDISRRAAVVDAVLAEHGERIRASRLFGTEPVVRAATNLSYYLVSDLELRTLEEAFEVQLGRSYSGFLVEMPGVFYLQGGGMSYGLQRPYLLPAPSGVPEDRADLTGRQYTDEQYGAGATWRGWSLEGAWARGQQIDATADGRADASTLAERLQRAQVEAGSPFGVRLSQRWALGGGLENLQVGLGVNDAVEEVTDREAGDWVPRLDVGFRRSDYDGDDSRSHPRLLGAGVTQDLGWLVGALFPDLGALDADVRALADADVARGRLQLALAEGRLGLTRELMEAELHGGASLYQDEGLIDVIGVGSVAGLQGGGHFAMALWNPTCPVKKPECRPAAMKVAVSVTYRDSWAEELRYVTDFAGKPQTYAYVELMGGR